MKHYLFSYSRKRQYLLFLGDLFVLLLAIAVSYTIRIYLNNHEISLEKLFAKFSPWLILVLLPHFLSLYLLDLYNLNRLIYRFRSSLFVILSVICAGVAIGAIFFFMPKYIFGRQVLLIHVAVASFMLVGWRITFHEFFSSGETSKRLAFIGSRKLFDDFRGKLDGTGMVISSVYVFPEKGVGNSPDVETVTCFDSVDSLLEQGQFDIVVFDILGNRLNIDEVTLLMQMKFVGKSVFDLPTFFKNITGKVPLDYVDGAWLSSQQSMQGQIGKPYIHCKRLMDIVGALLLLVLFFPLIVLISLAVKMESKGPALYIQERLGLHMLPFKCLKFRTMVDNAEETIGPTWSSADDPRVTRLGRVLRKTRLDELPQLLNILKGDLSFVGPRPIRKHFAEMLSREIPCYDLRYSVQPGLSGWAQVHKCYAVPDGYKSLEYELFYIQNISLFIDMLVIIKTMRTVIMGHGK